MTHSGVCLRLPGHWLAVHVDVDAAHESVRVRGDGTEVKDQWFFDGVVPSCGLYLLVQVWLRLFTFDSGVDGVDLLLRDVRFGVLHRVVRLGGRGQLMSKEKRQGDKTAHMHTHLHLVAALSIQTGRGDEAGAVVPGSGQKDEVARKGLVFLHKDHVPHLRRTRRRTAESSTTACRTSC